MEDILKLDMTNKIDNGLEKVQNSFLETTLGSIIDNSINVGIKSIFPDFIENEVIDVKNALFQDGIKSAFNEAISSAIDLGKSTIGIFTGNFENLDQIQQAIKKGGLLDTVSDILDKAIKFSEKKGIIDKNVAKALKAGKNIIINNVSSNIEDTLTNQTKAIEKMNKYCENWKAAYKEENLDEMKKEYKKIKEELKNIVPLENTINTAREIENLQILINNNGGDFNITSEQEVLSKIL